MKRITLLALAFLLVACTGHRIKSPNFIIDPRPNLRPSLVDRSPMQCPECKNVNDQTMWKFTERDFVQVREKLIELDDYIEYLLQLIKPKNSS